MILFSAVQSEYDEADQNQFLERCLINIAKGDKQYLADLYGKTDKRVYGLLLVILKSTEDAEDAMQDTYIKIWNKAGSYTAKGNPMSWILTIARNEALDRYRRKKYIVDISDEQWEQIADTHTSFTVEDRVTLKALLEELNEEERQIVILHALWGMKHREISDVMQIPLSTVLSKYNRSIKKMQAKGDYSNE